MLALGFEELDYSINSLNERLATLITTQKNLNSLQHTIAEKRKKILQFCQKYRFWSFYFAKGEGFLYCRHFI